MLYHITNTTLMKLFAKNLIYIHYLKHCPKSEYNELIKKVQRLLLITRIQAKYIVDQVITELIKSQHGYQK